MGRPYVFSTDTTLYHPSEGARVFPAGETDPGPAWTDKRGGEPADKGTTKQALKDLIAAQDQIDALGEQLVARDRDLAVIGQERDEANGKVHDLEQRAITAEGAQKAAEDAARAYMVERDQAREEAAAGKTKLSDAAATIERVTAEASEAAQALADAKSEIEGLKAAIKPLDGDGDGKPGGGKTASKAG